VSAFQTPHLPPRKCVCHSYLSRNQAIGIKTGGVEALRDGKSLHISGHVKAVQYHGISENVPYCVVKAKVTGETSLNMEPYSSWIIVHKEKGVVIEGYCICPAG